MALKKYNSPEKRTQFILNHGYKTIKEFSKKSCISQTYLSRIINGNRFPSLENIFKISKLLREPVEAVASLWWHDDLADINKNLQKKYYDNNNGDKLIKINNKFYKTFE